MKAEFLNNHNFLSTKDIDVKFRINNIFITEKKT